MLFSHWTYGIIPTAVRTSHERVMCNIASLGLPKKRGTADSKQNHIKIISNDKIVVVVAIVAESDKKEKRRGKKPVRAV